MEPRAAHGTAADLGFARLVPLGDSLAALESFCTAVAPLRLPVAQACGRVAAAPVGAPADVPERALALREGWAVLAQETLGASSYAPSFATTPPSRVRAGDPLPADTDAVLPLPFVDAAAFPCEIYGSVAPSDGARARGADLAEGAILVDAGEVLRPEQVALLQLAGLTEIEVRVPSVTVLSLGHTDSPNPAVSYIAAAAEREGAASRVESVAADDAAAVARCLSAQEADLVLVLGDSGCAGIIFRALSAAGQVLAHGLAVRPGETMGCGVLARAAGPRKIPVVLGPERLECVLAAWLLLARPCLDRLAGRKPREPVACSALARKIVSAPGMSDLVLLRRAADGDGAQIWEPLATGDIPWSAILGAEAWLLVPAESEGFPARQKIFAQYL